jgi:hypothetical protein
MQSEAKDGCMRILVIQQGCPICEECRYAHRVDGIGDIDLIKCTGSTAAQNSMRLKVAQLDGFRKVLWSLIKDMEQYVKHVQVQGHNMKFIREKGIQTSIKVCR